MEKKEKVCIIKILLKWVKSSYNSMWCDLYDHTIYISNILLQVVEYIHNTSLKRTIQSYIKISNDNETRIYKVAN